MIESDRAVSDVIAFSLIFGIMIASIGFVAIVGFDTIGDVKNAEQLSSAEDAMLTINEQLIEMTETNSPVHSGEFRLGDGTLLLDDGPRMNVTVGYPNATVSNSYQLGTMEYRLGESAIVLEGGMVIRQDGDASVVLSEPPIHCGESMARINVLALRAAEDDQVTTAGTVTAISRLDRTRLMDPRTREDLRTANNVTISITGTDHLDAWDRAMEDLPGWEVTESGEYVCDDPDRGAIVRWSRITFQFLR